MSQEAGEELRPVLKAAVHDVRYFATLLRGVNFVNRATVTITKSGFTITAEESRTLLGTAYVFSDIFDEYEYNSEPTTASQNSNPNSQGSAGSQDDGDNAAFEIPLNTLMECLNIFGTAGAPTLGSAGAKHKKWRRADDSDEGSDGEGRRGRRKQGNAGQNGGATIDQYFSGLEKRTGMRMKYAGAGYPLTLFIAEDADGPTTTCEITTFDPEPHLELPFDPAQTVLKIILKSSWLREALSELDPSCDKLTFIGNPPPPPGKAPRRLSAATTKPMLRIQAAGTFGSTEMDYPNDREVLETFECSQTVSFTYRFGHISRTLRALQSSTKTSLRIDEEGLLSLQFLMPSPKPRGGSSDAFIEFRCLALDDEL